MISKVDAPADGLEKANLNYVSQLAEKSDIPMYLGLIPSAAEVWRDKLPEGAESWDQNAYLAQAAGLGLPMIDFSAALTAHADEPIFYRTDHHWTSLGAFYGANALLEVLGRESLKQESFTPEIASTSFNGTLYSQSGIHWLTPDTMEFWVKEDGLMVTSWRTGSPEPGILYDRSYLTEKDKYASFLGGNQPLCVIQNENARDGGKLLLIRDSYSDALHPSWPRALPRSTCWTRGITGCPPPSTRRRTASTPSASCTVSPTSSRTGTWCSWPSERRKERPEFRPLSFFDPNSRAGAGAVAPPALIRQVEDPHLEILIGALRGLAVPAVVLHGVAGHLTAAGRLILRYKDAGIGEPEPRMSL